MSSAYQGALLAQDRIKFHVDRHGLDRTFKMSDCLAFDQSFNTPTDPSGMASYFRTLKRRLATHSGYKWFHIILIGRLGNTGPCFLHCHGRLDAFGEFVDANSTTHRGCISRCVSDALQEVHGAAGTISDRRAVGDQFAQVYQNYVTRSFPKDWDNMTVILEPILWGAFCSASEAILPDISKRERSALCIASRQQFNEADMPLARISPREVSSPNRQSNEDLIIRLFRQYARANEEVVPSFPGAAVLEPARPTSPGPYPKLKVPGPKVADLVARQLTLNDFGVTLDPNAWITITNGVKVVQHFAQCLICTEDVSSKENVSMLECGHWYHPGCLQTWFEEQNTCPSCRRPVPADVDMQEVSKRFEKERKEWEDAFQRYQSAQHKIEQHREAVRFWHEQYLKSDAGLQSFRRKHAQVAFRWQTAYQHCSTIEAAVVFTVNIKSHFSARAEAIYRNMCLFGCCYALAPGTSPTADVTLINPARFGRVGRALFALQPALNRLFVDLRNSIAALESALAPAGLFTSVEPDFREYVRKNMEVVQSMLEQTDDWLLRIGTR